jgi:glycosyltransferase involved in cell wall biosynthesis
VATALLTTYLTGYRMPLFERLAAHHGVEVLCFGGGERYVPAWFSDLDRQLAEAPFPARRLDGPSGALAVGHGYDAVIAPVAGGAILPAAYLGARRYRRPFILWASVWSQPRSVAHAAALPMIRRIYLHADAVIAYGEHVRRFVARIRGRDDDIFVAPQSVEAELFGRAVGDAEIAAFRTRFALGSGPLALYTGRLAVEKGIEVLVDAWPLVKGDATLVLIGDGPLAPRVAGSPRMRHIGALPRRELPVAYAASELALVPSIPTPRFREPWGLVCNEAMHQARPVIASSSVGAVAGGLVSPERTGLVVAPGDARALAYAADRLLADAGLRSRLGQAARQAVTAYTYDAMEQAFDRALAAARTANRARSGAHWPTENSASRSCRE